jgi:hypothetical protein
MNRTPVDGAAARRANTDHPVLSVADAKGRLWTRKGPWEHYPQRMLQMRARAFALRDGFADVLRGPALPKNRPTL